MIPRTAATSNPYAFSLNDPMNLSDPNGLDPCGGNFFCISSSSSGDTDYSGLVAAAALGVWAANYLSATGSEPPMGASSKAAIAAYSTGFDDRSTKVHAYGLINDMMSTGGLGGVLKIGGGAAGFSAGVRLCLGGPWGCALGILLMAGSSDVAGAGVMEVITREHYASVAERVGGPFAGLIEEVVVNGAGLANAVNLIRGGGGLAPRGLAEPSPPPASTGGPWKVGDDVYAPTSRSNTPSWSTVRSRAWKNEAAAEGAAERYGAQNLPRMNRGLAPERFNPDKGGMEKMELSHEPIPARDGGREFVPRWPQDHARVDAHRRPGY